MVLHIVASNFLNIELIFNPKKFWKAEMLYPDSGISMDEEIVLGDMIWSYNKAEL